MDLSQWEEHFGKLLEDEVNDYLDEHAGELFHQDPMRSPEMQKQQTKEELMRFIRLDDAAGLLDRALSLIRDMLPQRISKEEWETCLNEFLNCDESLCEFFERDANGEISEEDFIPIHQMLGISEATLQHCYELGQWLFSQKDFDDARSIFGFLTTVAPYMPEFWISLGMCYNQMKCYQEAINTYKAAQDLFKDDPALYIHCANNYLANNDKTNASIELDAVKKIFDSSPECKAEWEKTYDYLCSRSEKPYEKQ